MEGMLGEGSGEGQPTLLAQLPHSPADERAREADASSPKSPLLGRMAHDVDPASSMSASESERASHTSHASARGKVSSDGPVPLKQPSATSAIDVVIAVAFAGCVTVFTALPDFALLENENFIPADLKFSKAQWGQIVSGGPVYARAVMTIVTAEFVDNVNRQLTLVWCLLIGAACNIVLTFCTDFGVYVVLRFIYNISVALLLPLSVSLCTRSTPSSSVGVSTGVVMAGSALGEQFAVLGAKIFQEHWKGSFIIASSLLVVLAVLYLILPALREDEVRRRYIGDVLISTAHTYRLFFANVICCPSLITFFVCASVMGALYSSVALTPLWLVGAVGFSKSRAIDTLSAMPLVQVIGCIGSSWIADILYDRYRLSRCYIIIFMTAFQSTSGLLLVHLGPEHGGDGLFWLLLVMEQLFLPSPIAALLAEAILLVPSQLSGTTLAICFGFFTLAFGLSGQIALDSLDPPTQTYQSSHANVAHNLVQANYDRSSDALAGIFYFNLIQIPCALLLLYSRKRDLVFFSQLEGESTTLLPNAAV